MANVYDKLKSATGLTLDELFQGPLKDLKPTAAAKKVNDMTGNKNEFSPQNLFNARKKSKVPCKVSAPHKHKIEKNNDNSESFIKTPKSKSDLIVQYRCRDEKCNMLWAERIAPILYPNGHPDIGVRGRRCRGCSRYGILVATYSHDGEDYHTANVTGESGICGDYLVDDNLQYLGIKPWRITKQLMPTVTNRPLMDENFTVKEKIEI